MFGGRGFFHLSKIFLILIMLSVLDGMLILRGLGSQAFSHGHFQ